MVVGFFFIIYRGAVRTVGRRRAVLDRSLEPCRFSVGVLSARCGTVPRASGPATELVSSVPFCPEGMMVYQETFVQRDQHRIYVRDHPGAEPAIILMHGLPDNVHLYDRLFPYLSPPRRVVAFDFLGWGSSDKPSGYPYTADNHAGDLDAVITQLGLGQVTLVAHDASGPPAIDWALDHAQRVAGLVLLNTYYCEMPTLRRPEAIWFFSTPVIRSVA